MLITSFLSASWQITSFNRFEPIVCLWTQFRNTLYVVSLNHFSKHFIGFSWIAGMVWSVILRTMFSSLLFCNTRLLDLGGLNLILVNVNKFSKSSSIHWPPTGLVFIVISSMNTLVGECLLPTIITGPLFLSLLLLAGLLLLQILSRIWCSMWLYRSLRIASP